MCILSFPSQIWAKRMHSTRQNMVYHVPHVSYTCICKSHLKILVRYINIYLYFTGKDIVE